MDTSTVVDSLTAQRDPIYDNDGWLSMLRSGANPPPALHNTLEQEIAGIQAEADLITEQLLVLQKQHDYLQADIQRREALLRAPIRRLPVELLMEIFHHVRVESLQYYTVEHCTPLDYYISHEEETIMPIFLPSFLFPPPHVCAWWRQITLRATELQPYVGMTSDYLSNTAAIVNSERANRCLHDVPYPSLRLALHDGPSGRYDEEKPIDTLDTFIVHAARCKALDLRIPWSRMEHMCTLVDFPQLKAAALAFDGECKREIYNTDYSPPVFFQRAPLLSQLTIQGRQDGSRPFRLPCSLPWAQITNMHLNRATPSIYVHVLRNGTFLQKLWFEVSGRTSGSLRPPPEPFCLPELQELTLSIRRQERSLDATKTMNQFIDYVNTPSLSNLRAVYTSMPRLLRLLKRSCCDLLHLWLACDSSSLSMGIEEIAELVVMAPNLRSLAIEYTPTLDEGVFLEQRVPDFHKFIEGVVDLLPPQPPSIYSIYHDPRTLAKPRALALEAFTWRCRELDDYSVQRMLDAMSWGASALQRNEVHLTTPLPPYIVQRIRDSDRPLDIYGLDSCVEMYKALPLRRPDYPFSERFEGPSMWI